MNKAIAFCFLLPLWGLPGFCADLVTLQGEIAAYNSANYRQAVDIGNKLITEQPGNETARYYLANAFSRLDLLPEAIQQYNFCATVGNDPTIRSYAKEALSVLNHYSNTGTTTQSSWVNPSHFAFNPNTYRMNVANDEQLINAQAGQLQSYMYANQQSQLWNAQYEHDVRAQHIQNHANWLSASLPQYSGYDYWGEPAYNPYYSANQAYINGRANMRMLWADYHLHNQQNYINWNYNQGVAGLNNSVVGLDQGLEKPSGDMQLSPVGTNLYIRNYVNYDAGSPPEPPVITGLKAVAQSLKGTATK